MHTYNRYISIDECVYKLLTHIAEIFSSALSLLTFLRSYFTSVFVPFKKGRPPKSTSADQTLLPEVLYSDSNFRISYIPYASGMAEPPMRSSFICHLDIDPTILFKFHDIRGTTQDCLGAFSSNILLWYGRDLWGINKFKRESTCAILRGRFDMPEEHVGKLMVSKRHFLQRCKNHRCSIVSNQITLPTRVVATTLTLI